MKFSGRQMTPPRAGPEGVRPQGTKVEIGQEIKKEQAHVSIKEEDERY